MKSRLIASTLALAWLAGCTDAQLETAQSYQDKIAFGCELTLAATAFAPTISVFAEAACLTEAGFAKLLLDPSSHAWLLKLRGQAKGLI